MTDRDLLESAAKAAGLTTHRYCEPWNAMAEYTLQDGYYGPSWNPLTSDGDAFRLAVKLELFNLGELLTDLDINDRSASHYLEPLAATRRAIVRAAAQIGKAMQ